MRVKKIYLPGTGGAVAESIAANQDATANTPITLAAGADSIDPPQPLTFTFDGDSSAVDFTIVGLNRRGMQITEVIEGGNAGDVTTRGIYSQVLSITPDVTDAGTFEVANSGRNISPWIMMNTINSHDFNAYGNAMTYEDPELNNGPCGFDFTWQNVMRDGEEVAFQAAGSVLDGSVGGQVDLPPCTFVRVWNDEPATNVAVAIARPGF